MYLAMNRFTVSTENAEEFEGRWLKRESRLKEVDGFVEFHMLKSHVRDDGTILFASHTVWKDEEAFLAWTKSDQFRNSHKSSGESRKLHEGYAQFEGFTSIQRIAMADA